MHILRRMKGARNRIGVVFALLLLSAATYSVPGLARLTDRAWRMFGLSHEERRQVVMGDFYYSLRTLDSVLLQGEDVAIVMKQLRDVDRGVFVNYHVYPRRARFYFGLDHYRHDPARPETIWYIDLDRSDQVRQMTYEAVRVEQAREATPIGRMVPELRIEGEWIVPLVAAVDGRGKERYTTEAVFLSSSNTRVQLELMPDGARYSLDLEAGEPAIVSDLMPWCFGRTGTGWLRISTDDPVHTGFWLANRGAGVLAPVRLFGHVPATGTSLAGGERLWVLNPNPRSVVALANGVQVELGPMALISLGASPSANVVESNEKLIAFVSQKEADGNTTFGWPEAAR